MLHRDFVAFAPPLNGGVVLMVQEGGNLADAPKPRDNGGVGFHNPLVRMARTFVNLECVRSSVASGAMAGDATLGARLTALAGRSGLKGDKLAKKLGYERRSGIQRILDDGYDPEYAPPKLQERFEALVGLGEPPITTEDVLEAFGVPAPRPLRTFTPPHDMAYVGSLDRNVPIWGGGLGAKIEVEVVGKEKARLEVDQFDLRPGDILGHLRRPPQHADNPQLYGLYIEGESMFPRFDDGQAVLVDPRRPPLIGDDIVLHLALPDDQSGEEIGAVLVKRLRRKSTEYYELEQFNPHVVFRLPRDMVKSVQRIITYGELLS